MTQKTTGWRSVLSLPGIYELCQNLLAHPHTHYGGPQSQDSISKKIRFIAQPRVVRAEHLEFVENYIRPVPGMRILDIGCGPASILEVLPRDIHYVGVDLSLEYIQAAREKYGNRGQFHHLSVESLPESDLGTFDLVMGLGVLHHLGDEEVRRFFSMAAGALFNNGEGRCLTVDPCFVAGQHPIARLLIRMDRRRNVRTPDDLAALARTCFSCFKQDIRHDRLRLPYTHHIMECRI